MEKNEETKKKRRYRIRKRIETKKEKGDREKKRNIPSQGVAFPQIFVFLARSSLDLRHKKFDPLGSASPPQVAQSFRQPFATSRVKRVNIKKIKKQREKLEEMMTSLHKRMSRGLSVSLNHKKQTIAAEPCLNIQTDAFSFVDSGPSTQTFSHAQITPTRTSFSILGQSHHCLHSFLLVTCLVLCHQISLARHKEQKKEKKNENLKQGNEKRKKKWFSFMKMCLKNNWSKEIRKTN